MSHQAHRKAGNGFRAIAFFSFLLMVSGCASVSPRTAPARNLAFPVPVVNASVSDVKPAPDAVSDAEVSAARAALRQASEWGAKYYAPPMYATAQATFESALAARDGDPARCRSLLAQATDTANSARQAALTAYEGDVKNRFNASRAKLVEIGADRAFPDEFGQLVSGIDSATGLFADGSYWDARFKAYTILKGMTDLYDTVHGILDWLKDAQIRVQNAIDAAQALDALQWAPAAMRDAEGKYHDALAQMQAGNLKAAVDSMKAAGQIALNMPYLKDTMDRRGARAPASGVSPAGAPPEGARTLPREPAVQPPPVASSFPGQRVRIADMSMSSLGAPQKLYMTFSAAIARFDVVAAEGLSDAGVMEKVLSGMDDSWEAAVSRSGYFGFIYNDRIQMVKDLGAYPEKGQFLHTPYAAQFRLVGTRFAVNLVLCHLEASKDRKPKAAETAGLADVYHYYEKLTGNRGITLLLAGGLNGVSEQTSESLIPQGEMVSLHTVSREKGRRMYASVALQPLIEESGIGTSAPREAYVVLKSNK